MSDRKRPRKTSNKGGTRSGGPGRSVRRNARKQNYNEDSDSHDSDLGDLSDEIQDDSHDDFEEDSSKNGSDELSGRSTRSGLLILKVPSLENQKTAPKRGASVRPSSASVGRKNEGSGRASRASSVASVPTRQTRRQARNVSASAAQLDAIEEDDETAEATGPNLLGTHDIDRDAITEQEEAAETVEDDEDEDEDLPVAGGRRNILRRNAPSEASPDDISPGRNDKRLLSSSKRKSKNSKKGSRRSNDDDEFNPDSSGGGSADESGASEGEDEHQEPPINDFIDDDEVEGNKRTLRPKRNLETAFAAEVLVREERRSRPKGPMTAGLPQYVNAALDSGWTGMDGGIDDTLAIDSRQNSKRRKLWKNTDIMPSIAGPFGRLGPEDLEALNPGLDKSGIDPEYFDDDVSTLGRINTVGASATALDPDAKTSPHDRSSPPPKTSRKHAGDFDPVSVDTNVTFDDVGGRSDEIARLRQMVIQPLMYPEMFASKGIKPPRGVLFHGPPGTGKTMIARALAAEMSRSGQKVAFFQRKGSDALSKWVGEAERNLKDLFETARKQQPSIIFFDEIDGLAPVRSSKSDQIYASIVSTLLALMDGIDDRGQVIIIGATNRPDNLDPALRRGGRFDVEYHFSLPDEPARAQILRNITKKWDQEMEPGLLEMIARMTSGYAGADLSSLCTEAALNSMQRTYPQIYETDRKLLIQVAKIKVIGKDFKMAMRKVRPASDRTGSIPARLLEESVVPLLGQHLELLSRQMDEIMPLPDRMTALEDAKFEQPGDEDVAMQQEMDDKFRDCMIYRPRLLLTGMKGMGQKHLAKAILHRYESIYHRTLSLGTLDEDSGLSHGSAINKLIDEARRQKPSIVYIPDLKQLYRNVEDSALAVLRERLDELGPHEAVMVLAVYEKNVEDELIEPEVLSDIFSVGCEETIVDIPRPGEPQRRQFLSTIVDQIRRAPTSFPAKKRKQRQLEELEEAPKEAPKQPDEVVEEHYDRFDRKNTLLLKNFLDPLKKEFAKAQTYRLFNAPVVPEEALISLKPDFVVSDLAPAEYEFAEDRWGYPGYRDTRTNRFFYNLDLNIIENRLHNGYYARMKDMYADFKRLYYDYAIYGPQEKAIKALELMYNIEADVTALLRTTHGAALEANGEKVFIRRRAWEKQQKSMPRPQTGISVDSGVDPALHKSEPGQPRIRPLGDFLEGGLNSAQDEHSNKRRKLDDPESSPHRRTSSSRRGSRDSQASKPLSRPTSRRSEEPGFGAEQSAQSGLEPSHDSEALMSQNGTHNGTHGSHSSYRLSEDAVMGNSPEEISGRDRSGPHTQNTQSRSQKSAITAMSAHSQAADYHNSASTTTSGHKTNNSSGPSNGTQASNGVHPSQKVPDFDEHWSGGSQLPDTQEMGMPPSSQSRPNSQSMLPPRVQRNSDSSAAEIYGNLPEPKLVGDDKVFQALLDQLVDRTSGCSVEQLENIYATMMGVIWRYRDEWNRTEVANNVTHAFNRTMSSIDRFQKTLQPSQG